MKKKALIWLSLIAGLLLLIGCGGEAAEEALPSVDAAEPAEDRPEPGDMVRIPGGKVTIGTDENAIEPYFETPAHEVEIDEFEIDAFEVTNFQFREFQLDDEVEYMPQGNWREYDGMGREFYPVVNVTFRDAKAYCEWAGKRLPTEAEWEHAARGPDNTRYPWGDEFNANNTNTDEYGMANVIEVGRVETDKSTYGVYDMMGNVQEWVDARFRPYPGTKTDRSQPVFRTPDMYVVRGGGFRLKANKLGLWTRMGYPAGAQYAQGFRCARDIEGAAEAEQ